MSKNLFLEIPDEFLQFSESGSPSDYDMCIVPCESGFLLAYCLFLWVSTTRTIC
jgi:hypothetical protein